MRTSSKIAAAVAIALGTGSAFAANPVWTVSLNVAGSSAMRDAFLAEINTFCQAPATAFVSTGVAGEESPDFRAWACNVTAASGLPAGTGIIVYYRSEGGSIFGVFGNPALNSGTSLPINRLNIGVSGGTTGPLVVGETVAQLQADSQTGAVTKDVVQLGISDVEPTAFVGENYGSEYSFITFPQPTVAQLGALPIYGNIIGQVFSPIVSNTGGTAGFTNATGFSANGFTSQELASIFAGTVTDWSKVPSAQALGGSGAITLCRRDAGSGTQTITSTHFLGTNCSSAGLPFDFTGSSSGNTVITNFATGDVLTCVKSNPGSIGIVTLQTAAKITGAAATQVTVDGTIGSAANAAQGKYTYYGEVYAVKNTAALTGSALTLANKIVADLELATNTPASASVPNLVALPEFNTPFTPVLPLKTGQQIPIGIGTTGGNTCTPVTDVL